MGPIGNMLVLLMYETCCRTKALGPPCVLHVRHERGAHPDTRHRHVRAGAPCHGRSVRRFGAVPEQHRVRVPVRIDARDGSGRAAERPVRAQARVPGGVRPVHGGLASVRDVPECGGAHRCARRGSPWMRLVRNAFGGHRAGCLRGRRFEARDDAPAIAHHSGAGARAVPGFVRGVAGWLARHFLGSYRRWRNNHGACRAHHRDLRRFSERGHASRRHAPRPAHRGEIAPCPAQLA